MKAVAVLGVGLLGPGLADWRSGQALLRDTSQWRRAATVVPAPVRLPANERRRAGNVVKASVEVADQAVHAAGADAALLRTVFTSSTGDPLNCHLLCEALASAGRLVSPTRFTNSVHNAAAGYWHIAAASRQPSTSLAAFDASFGAGLLEAVAQCLTAEEPVLLVACDVPYPEPLHALRPLDDAFALALVLAPVDGAGGAGGGAARTLRIDLAGEAQATPCEDSGLEALRLAIPAARALPLLQALARDTAARLVIEGLPGSALRIEVGAR